MRLFAALWPASEVMAGLDSLPRPDTPGLRWTTHEQWHVTLRFYGEVDDRAVPRLCERLREVKCPSGTAVLGPVTGAFGRHLLHAPVAGVDDLAAAVNAATATWGSPTPRFKGHLTLARSKGRASLRPLTGVPVAGEWRFDSFDLVRSELSPQGARYTTVQSFPLTG